MRKHRFARRAAILGLAAVPLLLAGCGLFKAEETGGYIDPPQMEYDLDMESDLDLGGHDWEVSAVPADEAPVTLYFKDRNGYVAPIGLRIPAEPGIAKLALSYMVEGGPGEALLPEGFSALLPAGTEILGMDISPDGVAYVDFSEAFTQYNPQDERKILEAVTWALTSFNSVNSVQIWVNGKPLKEMPQDATPIDGPLTRAMGINLELDNDVNPALASPVTLYFQSQTTDDYVYYVPVTRLIRYTEDMTLAALQELADGPADGSGLHGVLAYGTEILNVELMDDTVVVNFGERIQGDLSLNAAAMQAVVLSLTEQTQRPKVQIMVEGKVGIVIGDKTEFAAPVTRPAQLNPVTI